MKTPALAIGAVLVALSIGGCGGDGSGTGGPNAGGPGSGGAGGGGPSSEALRAIAGGQADEQNHPVAAAVNRGDTDAVAALLAKGFDPYNGDSQNTPPLILAVRTGNLKMIELLLKHRAEPEIRSRVGDVTALMLAVDLGNKEAVRLLLDNRASPSTAALQGDTPLLRSLRQGNVEIAELLIDRGADLNFRSKGVSALESAIKGGREAIACRMIEKGAGMNDPSQPDLKTALMLAAEHDMLKAAELLLAKRARTDAKDAQGKTALDYAKSQPMKELLTRPAGNK